MNFFDINFAGNFIHFSSTRHTLMVICKIVICKKKKRITDNGIKTLQWKQLLLL